MLLIIQIIIIIIINTVWYTLCSVHPKSTLGIPPAGDWEIL
jgi:hypothetical protein